MTVTTRVKGHRGDLWSYEGVTNINFDISEGDYPHRYKLMAYFQCMGDDYAIPVDAITSISEGDDDE